MLQFMVDSLPFEPPGEPKNTGVGSLSVLQQLFLTQDSNRGLLHCRHLQGEGLTPLSLSKTFQTK